MTKLSTAYYKKSIKSENWTSRKFIKVVQRAFLESENTI